MSADMSKELLMALRNSHKVILDMRDESEIILARQGGGLEIPGSINLPFNSFSQHAHLLPEDKEITVIVYCRSGNRAGRGKVLLESMGYKHVVNGINSDTLKEAIASI